MLAAALLPLLALWPASARAQGSEDAIYPQDEQEEAPVPPRAPLGAYGNRQPAPYTSGELLVRFKFNPLSRAAKTAHDRVGAKATRTFNFIGWQKVRLPRGMTVAQGLARYRGIADVEVVQPNYKYFALKSKVPKRRPNDPGYADQYGMRKIKAPQAWAVTTGSRDVVVAVLDTGVDFDHEDLRDNMWRNEEEVPDNDVDDDDNGFVDDVFGIDTFNGDSDPRDDDGHGTGVAGVLGAVGDNGIGVAGVNWQVRIMALKALSATGEGDSETIAEAMEYMIKMKKRGVNIRVANHSYGSLQTPEAVADTMLQAVFDRAGNAGILSTVAAGNTGTDDDASPFFPANLDSPSIISVGASNKKDKLAKFSNFGVRSVDLVAPGKNILTTTIGGYGKVSGTSFSTPHVGGAAALLFSLDNSLTVARVKAAILENVDWLPQFSGVVASGGRLNVQRALASLLPPGAVPAVPDTPGGSHGVMSFRAEWN